MNISKKSIEFLNYFISISLALAGAFSLIQWFKVVPPQDIEIRLPKDIDYPAGLQRKKIDIKGQFSFFTEPDKIIEGSWPCFRGPLHDNISREGSALLEEIDPAGPEELWSIGLGEGYAGAAVANGRVYILDYDKKNGGDSLRCFSFSSGDELWRRTYKIDIKRNHGFSRTVPAVNASSVVSLGPKGQVMCLDPETGSFKWSIDLESEYGSEIPLWYTAQCPLIDGRRVIIAPAGKKLMIAVDSESGKVLWETENKVNYKMSHSSIVPMTFFGEKQYVYCALGGITSVKASGPEAGKILWQSSEWNHSVISPSPVQLPENMIFVTAGYGKGSMLFKVEKTPEGQALRKIEEISREIFASEQHTPLFYNGLLYTILPNDGGDLNRQLVCMDTSGRIKWTSGKGKRFGLGPFMVADNKIFILDDTGNLTVAEASDNKYSELWSCKILPGRESWAPLAITNGRLLARDFTRLVCLDISKHEKN